MGNSIEEDIKILEEFKTNGYHILLMKYGDRIKTNFKLEKALEHILSAYKRVLKENEELKEDRDKFKKALGKRITYCNELEKDLFENCSNYVIPIQTIKDKIKELNKKEKQELKGTKGQDRYDIKQQYMYQRNILQELLEGRKENERK